MKRIGIFIFIIYLLGLYSCQSQKDDYQKQTNIQMKIQEEKSMKIKVSNQMSEIIYLLKDNTASQTLYQQLPLDITVENYGNNEKIFYPLKPLDTTDTPLLQEGGKGTLAYFALWDDVVMYYGESHAYSELYILGEAIEGSDYIQELSGQLHIERVGE
ncbi:cyclophilin-like fold protein [Candidatus Stoquefichus massiliensis]|uniref:cyclophilin-like fold protein n=1 Tax=Candidatus Stoquefichus massiliensis TaxID=1470350 RepID=UPI000482239C|nr:cyclophilin-like fold protein [Candidatus Stoquefichus massiliensis]